MSFNDLTLGLKILSIIYVGMIGAVFASFFTCIGERIAEGKDWIKSRSVCNSCGHLLTITDLIPIFSYIFRGGKCRYCGKKIPVICLITEIAMAFSFILIFIKYGFSVETIRYCGLTGLLLGLSVVDLKTYEIPDGFHIAGIILWLVTLPFMGSEIKYDLIDGLLGGFGVAGFILIVSLIMDKILKKDTLGGGDIKLLFVVGLYLGLLQNIFNLILSCFIGIIFVFVLKKNRIPFGPAISTSTVISILIASYVIRWYLGLFII